MTTLNDFTYTDLVDDHLAAHVNELLGAVLRAEFRNVETITATKELADGDCQFQNITASGADRTVELAPEATTNHLFVITNVGGSNNVPIKDDSGATTYDTLSPGEMCIAIPNGSSWKVHVFRTASGGSNSICDGRLTLATGVPVTTTDQTAKTTVYFTPYVGNKIALYDGSSTWNVRTFTEISVAVPSTTNTPFDIFCYDNSGTPTLETVNWTNDTTRATALAYQNGVLVKSGATTRRYLGTGRTTGVSGQTEDSVGGSTTQVGGKRFLWNYYNRVARAIKVKDTTATWSYTTATWRQANNTAGNKVELVIGYAEDMVQANVYGVVAIASNSGANAMVAVGVDSTTSPSGFIQIGFNASASTLIAPVSGAHHFIPSAGYHYLAWIEKGADSTCTFQGDAISAGQETGMAVSMMG